MCLKYIMTDKEKDEWLKRRKGKNLTCYKLVWVSRESAVLEPPYYGKEYNFGKNIITEKPDVSLLVRLENGSGNSRDYHPYFHLFYKYEEALEWVSEDEEFIVKCRVPKSCVEYIGLQGDIRVIVATEFTFA